ncbi:MAG: hypothetical protein ACJ70X_07010 [Nitrososphaera sp.]
MVANKDQFGRRVGYNNFSSAKSLRIPAVNCGALCTISRTFPFPPIAEKFGLRRISM